MKTAAGLTDSSLETRYLLTPGPLTTSPETRRAMLRDWGSRDKEFIELTARVRARLLELAGASDTHACVPLQGSGTYAIEAALGSLVPRKGKVLVPINGAYGRRMARLCETIGRSYAVLERQEDQVPSLREIEETLARDSAITHVALVHCETSSGILNPLEKIAALAAERGCGLLIDAMSSFGAIEIDARKTRFDALIASANKCLEGVPGMSFVIARGEALEKAAGNAHSLSLDLYDQWKAMEGNGQWRFTPPTHVVAALEEALKQHAAEGGVAGRGARYRENCRILVEGMRALGCETFLSDGVQAPIIVTFRNPRDANFAFERFYEELRERGYLIYPGKLTMTPSFRIGCIGQVGPREMKGLLEAVRQALEAMDIRQTGP